jgi:hypothetical protein
MSCGLFLRWLNIYSYIKKGGVLVAGVWSVVVQSWQSPSRPMSRKKGQLVVSLEMLATLT